MNIFKVFYLPSLGSLAGLLIRFTSKAYTNIDLLYVLSVKYYYINKSLTFAKTTLLNVNYLHIGLIYMS